MTGAPPVAQLSVEQVTRVFPAPRARGLIEALKPIDLAVARNDFITILGPSGCGKSTLLRIVAGLDTPTAGRVLLDGRPVAGPGPDRGMVFQNYTLFPWLTVRDNICFGLREKGMALAAQHERAAFSSTGSGSMVSSITTPSSSPAACSSARRWPGR